MTLAFLRRIRFNCPSRQLSPRSSSLLCRQRSDRPVIWDGQDCISHHCAWKPCFTLFKLFIQWAQGQWLTCPIPICKDIDNRFETSDWMRTEVNCDHCIWNAVEKFEMTRREVCMLFWWWKGKMLKGLWFCFWGPRSSDCVHQYRQYGHANVELSSKASFLSSTNSRSTTETNNCRISPVSFDLTQHCLSCRPWTDDPFPIDGCHKTQAGPVLQCRVFTVHDVGWKQPGCEIRSVLTQSRTLFKGQLQNTNYSNFIESQRSSQNLILAFS
jgi:hypothetical protein